MPVMIPSQEQLALWAAEELWDWRVRMLFGAVCAVALLAVLFVYLAWGRGERAASNGRARRYMGRISVTLFAIAAGEALFFKDVVSTLLLLAVTSAIGFMALNMAPDAPGEADAPEGQDGSEEVANGEA